MELSKEIILCSAIKCELCVHRLCPLSNENGLCICVFGTYHGYQFHKKFCVMYVYLEMAIVVVVKMYEKQATLVENLIVMQHA